MIPAILFYLFSGCLVMSAVGVVVPKNPLYAVLLLIVAFFNAAALFLLSGSEFIAMILLIVYVGAVAVLFLFVVMMLDVGDDKQTKHLALGYTRMAAFVAMLFGAELVVVALTWWSFPKAEDFIAHPQPLKTHNAQALGEILYTHYFYIFQLAGLILLVAMVGAIVLCFAPGIKRNLKKQSSQKQLNRTKASSLHLVDGEFRKGVTPCS